MHARLTLLQQHLIDDLYVRLSEINLPFNSRVEWGGNM